MQRADKANPTLGNGGGNAAKGTAAGSASNPLTLPARNTHPNIANVSKFERGSTQAFAAAPRLTQLFGSDHHRSAEAKDRPVASGPIPRAPGAATPFSSDTAVTLNRLVLGVTPKPPVPDSTVFDPANLPDQLRRVYLESRSHNAPSRTPSLGNAASQLHNQVVPVPVAQLERHPGTPVQVPAPISLPSAPSGASATTATQVAPAIHAEGSPTPTATRLQEPKSAPTTSHQPLQVETTARVVTHQPVLSSAGVHESLSTTVETLRSALHLATGHGPVRNASVAGALPAVQALSSSSNVFVRHAASTVVVVLGEALRGAPLPLARIAEVESQINRIERGVGVIPASSSGSAPEKRPLAQHSRGLPERGGAQRSLEICKESLRIVKSLQDIEPKLSPEVIARTTQVMATTVARHIAPLSKQLLKESASVASHLSELSRSLTAIASRGAGKVDLRAFTLRLEGLLHVLALHIISPRIKQDVHGGDASTRELFQQISAHLTALHAYRTGRRPSSAGGNVAELTDGVHGEESELLLALLVHAASPGKDDPTISSSAAERLAKILRATSL